MKNLINAAVITTAAYLGLAIAIGVSFGVYWPAMEPEAFMLDFEVKFPLLLPGAGVTIFPALILTLVLFLRSPKGGAARKSWQVAFFAMLLINVITLVYHIPVNLNFMDQSYSAAQASGKLAWWVGLHWVRVALAVVASWYAVSGLRGSLES